MSFKTLPVAFIENVKKQKNKPFLFYKQEGKWKVVSWNEVGEIVKYLTLGLIGLGVQKGDRICAISETRPEMAYICLAISASGGIFTPIYHTNSPNECAHVLKDSGAKIAYAEDEAQLEKLKIVWKECPSLEMIVVNKLFTKQNDSRIITLNQLIELGKEELKKKGEKVYYESIESIQSKDISAIIYTSGTTGPPKGVIDTNETFIKNLEILNELFPFSEKSRGISALPMAHGIELRNGHWSHVLYGFPQIYAQSIRTIYDDIREMKPTYFFIPPRFYEKIYNEMMDIFASVPSWKRRLFEWCLRIGMRYQNNKESHGNKIFSLPLRLCNLLGHFILFRTVRRKMGGKVEWASSGGAPIQPKILNFFRACGIGVYEGYGLTESSGLIGLNHPGAWKIGTVGKPSRGLELKFANDGEILVRGWARCGGYWNNPKATVELFGDGWLHTGDLGYLDEDGFLCLTGRKKEIIITSTGKNISPMYIENLLKRIPYINEAVVFGEGKTYLTALVTLNEEATTKYAIDQGLTFSDFTSLAKHPKIKELITMEINEVNKQLARIEQVKKFTILEGQFSQEFGELTPTMKVKRKIIEERYRDRISAMYSNE